MAPRLTAPRSTTPRYALPRYATLCAIAALAVGLSGCAATSEPARTAQKTVAATKAPEANTGDALARIARQSLEGGDPVSAVSMLKRAHEMSPESASILADLGRTLAALKSWREASDAYAKAVDLAPKDPAYRRGHAGALLALDLPTLAEQEFRAALALHEDAPTLSGLGVTLDLQNRHEEALASFRRALELDPNGTPTRTNLGLSLALWGASNEAIGLLAPMAASSTADARQRQNLALVFGLAGDMDQARAVAKMDLSEEAVRSNLSYYETLRGLTPTLRMRSLMGNQTPTAATTGAAQLTSTNVGEPTAKPADATPPAATPAKPSRSAEMAPEKIAPEKKTPAKPLAAAAPKTDSKIATPDVAETVPAKSPRVKAAAAPAKPVEPKADAAAAVPAESAATRSVAEAPTVAPEAAAATPPVATTESTQRALDDLAADVRAAATTESHDSTVATPADETPAAHNASADAPVAPEPANDNEPAARTDVPAQASELNETPASGTAAAVEPKVETSETPAASASAESDGAVKDVTTGSATASVPAPEQDPLPEVSVRVGGVPLASVPQSQVTQPLPAAAVVEPEEAAAPMAPESNESKSDVSVADESKSESKPEATPMAEGESADLPPPPSSEPLKRDGPTKLLPQSHAAIEPLY